MSAGRREARDQIFLHFLPPAEPIELHRHRCAPIGEGHMVVWHARAAGLLGVGRTADEALDELAARLVGIPESEDEFDW